MTIMVALDMKELLRRHRENIDIFNECLTLTNRMLTYD